MRKIFIVLNIVLTINAWSAITMQIDSKQINIEQTFKLILTLDDIQDNSIPDFNSLQNDFTIVGTERNMSYTVIDGRAHVLNQWILILMPKRTGQLIIPPIKFLQEHTAAAQILVTNNTPLHEVVLNKNKLLINVDNMHPYVNQQVIYTVKLYNDGNLLNSEYIPPAITDGLLITLGEPKHYRIENNNKLYSVDELQYAIFPQKSGQLKIIPPSVKALMFAAKLQKIKITTNAINLQVKSIPSNTTLWLPAKDITLQETYDNLATIIKYDSTLVRTITVQGIGIAGQLLPSLNFETHNKFKIYPEKSIENTIYKNTNLIGTSVIKLTYLFNHSGKIIIPKVKLIWFNTTQNKFRTTSLPQRVIFIKK